MYLDAYYKLQAYSKFMLAKTYTSDKNCYITVPAVTSCAGTEITAYYCGSTSWNNLCGLRSPFGRPIEAILSQKTVIPTGTAHAESNIVVGSGTTAPTARDTAIEEEILTLVCSGVVADFNAAAGELHYRKTMVNTADTPITVSEVGLTWPCIAAYNAADARQVLVYREVLAEPITVEPNGSFTVTITHKFRMEA